MNETLIALLIRLLQAKVPPEVEIRRNSRLADLGLASIDVVELAFEIEDATGAEINISAEDFVDGVDGPRTVDWLAQRVAAHQ